jgi:hypothetical protein
MTTPDVWGLLEEARKLLLHGEPHQRLSGAERLTAALALREQYVLVPREPTREMLCAWRDNEGTDEYFESGQGIGICYRAMLAAVEK